MLRHEGHTDMKNITGGQVDLLFVPELHNISVFHTTTGKWIFLKLYT